MKHAFSHGWKMAWEAIRRAPLSHLIASLTVGATLFVAVFSASMALGIRSLLASWGSRVELTLYLSRDLGEEEGRRLAEEAAAEVEGEARWVSPEEAMDRLRHALGDEEGILLGLPVDPLPASIELRPGRAVGTRELPRLAATLARLPGVDEVDWGRGWAERLTRLSLVAEGGLAAVLSALLAGTALLVGAVIRFTVHARRDEIDILKLLGASVGFIRLPFLLEGALAGGVGGAFASLAFHLFSAWERRLTVAIPFPHELSLHHLTSLTGSLGLLAGGAVLGLLATSFALARELRT